MLLSAQPLWLLGKNGSFPSHGLIMRTVKLCRNRAYSLVCVPSCLVKGRRFDKPSSLSALLDALQDPWAASLWERPLPGSWLVQYSGGLNPAYRQPPIWHSSLSFWPLFKYISMWIATLWKVVVVENWDKLLCSLVDIIQSALAVRTLNQQFTAVSFSKRWASQTISNNLLQY